MARAEPLQPDTGGVWDVPGQRRAAEVFAAAAAGGAVGHAWALLGPSGVGQDALARALTAALCCPRGEPGVACGECADCDRAARGAHPALHTFTPSGSAHRVDDVRGEWLPAASRTAPHWKVLRIEEADRLNDAAANAFLKALEEPPARLVWLLDVADPDELPDTVLSRCRQLRLAAVGSDVLDAQARRLGLADPDERALAVRAAAGSPARLAQLAEADTDGREPGLRGLDRLRAHRALLGRLRQEGQGVALLAWRELEDEVDARVEQVKEETAAEQAALAAAHGDEPPAAVVRELTDRGARREREARLDVLQGALDDLLAWIRDVLLVGAGGDPADAVNVDAVEALRDDAAALDPATLVWAADRVMRTRDDLERNVAARLAVEALLLELAAAVMGGRTQPGARRLPGG